MNRFKRDLLKHKYINMIKETAEKYSEHFTILDLANGDTRIILKDDAPELLRDAIKNAHGDKLPNDFIYSTFADLLIKIAEYDCKTIDDLENNRSEIVDGYVDIYTHYLTKWLSSDNDNVYYLGEAVRLTSECDDGFKLLAMAQYLAIDEVMQHVISLLESN